VLPYLFLFVFLIATVATAFSLIGVLVPFGPFTSRGHASKLAGLSFCALVAGFVGIGATFDRPVPSSIQHVSSITETPRSIVRQVEVRELSTEAAPAEQRAVAQVAPVEQERPAPAVPPTIRRAGVVSGGASVGTRHTTVAAPPSPPPATVPQSLTRVQRNAVRSANSYLSFMPFSRAGLIRQLSSSAGDGYSRADAMAAVDSLSVDWNEQAARAAESYLDMMGFSCSGLIEQLSSSAGDQYTRSEATYGARRAGAC
jgi:Host cell surface-exposed lipoprotein.